MFFIDNIFASFVNLEGKKGQLIALHIGMQYVMQCTFLYAALANLVDYLGILFTYCACILNTSKQYEHNSIMFRKWAMDMQTEM